VKKVRGKINLGKSERVSKEMREAEEIDKKVREKNEEIM